MGFLLDNYDYRNSIDCPEIYPLLLVVQMAGSPVDIAFEGGDPPRREWDFIETKVSLIIQEVVPSVEDFQQTARDTTAITSTWAFHSETQRAAAVTLLATRGFDVATVDLPQ